jgi:hypothetical protein
MAEGPPGPGDTQVPGTIGDLAAAEGPGEGEVDLAWTAPGDDGGSGQAASYLVRVLDRIIDTPKAWDAASPVGGTPAPAPAGSPEQMVVGGLVPGQNFWFCVRAVDDAGNEAPLSNSPSAPAGRERTPPVITDDRARQTGPGTLTFLWTTDELATSSVAWAHGLPPDGELGREIADKLLVTSHRLVLGGLRRQSTVWYRVGSVDAAGNRAVGPLRSIELRLGDVFPPVGGHPGVGKTPEGGQEANGSGAALAQPLRLEMPARTHLSSHPNPFERATGSTIEFGAASSGSVSATLAVYDLGGRLVRTLFHGEVARGETCAVRWDGANDAGTPVAAGVYLCRLELGTGETRERRLVVLR